MAVTLTVPDVKRNALVAYNEKRLVAQHHVESAYRTPDGCVCAIGASLSTDRMSKWPEWWQQQNLDHLVQEREIAIPDLTTFRRLALIQRRHDDWCNAPAETRAQAEREFLELIL